MHIPADYEIKDSSVIESFIRRQSFGQLVCAGNRFPIINHLPFIYDHKRHCLLGHLAKQNPDLKQLNQASVTVVFTGPHGYISPDWYEKPGVPTWNYQVVHITGTCHIDTSANACQQMVSELSELHQKSLGLTWGNDYNPAMLSAIVALKIEIQAWRCQFKLSQDRSLQDQHNVINALSELGQQELSLAMTQYSHKKIIGK